MEGAGRQVDTRLPRGAENIQAAKQGEGLRLLPVLRTQVGSDAEQEKEERMRDYDYDYEFDKLDSWQARREEQLRDIAVCGDCEHCVRYGMGTTIGFCTVEDMTDFVDLTDGVRYCDWFVARDPLDVFGRCGE